MSDTRRSGRLDGTIVCSSRRAPWWTCCLFHLVLAAPLAAETSEPKLVISPQIRAAAATELDFYVLVDSTNPVPAESSIIITGLPKSVTFSAGNAMGTGIWEVPLLALDRLKMVVTANEASSSTLVIFLAIKKKELVILASAHSELVIEAPTEEERRQVGAKQAEDERLAEAKRAEEARAAEAAKAVEDARRQDAAKKAEDKHVAEAKRAEEARAAEAAKARPSNVNAPRRTNLDRGQPQQAEVRAKSKPNFRDSSRHEPPLLVQWSGTRRRSIKD